MFTQPRLAALVTVLLAGLAPLPAAALKPAQFQTYIEQFNASDREIFAQAIPNAQAWSFLSANIPLFECPDQDLERTYYFRWWTFRKHLKQTPEGWVITEFLPAVPWAGKHNTINCAAAHHIREGRWLLEQKFVRDYFKWWLHQGGRARAYSFWIADSVLAWCDATGDHQPAREWLPDLIKNYESWERDRLDAVTGLFWQYDGSDGMEGAIGGRGYRPTINSYMYGDAIAIGRIAEMSGQPEVATTFRAKAARLKELVQTELWHAEHEFFEVREAPQGFGLFKWLINDDTTLTRAAKASASSPGPVANLNDGAIPDKSSNWATSHFDFAKHVGTVEWVQYDLPAPTQVSSFSLYIMLGGNLGPPERFRVLYRHRGEWQEATDVKGGLNQYTRWNKITFAPVQADAVKLELHLKGADRSALALRNVRELLGYVPWYFNLPDSRYGVAWKQLVDSRGFAAPFGLTTAEQRHPGFAVQYDRHECMWNGPVWPFATAQTLTALANHLNHDEHPALTRRDYLNTLLTYARSHRLQLADGATVSWIDEDQNPFTGDWIARTCILNWEAKDPEKWKRKGATSDRGKDYNHSTFCDLVINGLVGLRPRGDEQVEVNPLVPADTWDYFCLDRVPYHGRMLTILWDKTGRRYGRGAGLRVLADDREIAAAKTLQRVVGTLPAALTPAKAGYGGFSAPRAAPLATTGSIDKDFVNPPAHYKSRPLWFWNGTVTKDGIEKQMEGSVASGYYGFGIVPYGPNPRLGFTAKAPKLEPEYQSEHYYQLYKAAVDKAEQLGMKMCLYDEYNFPSGTVGGRLSDVYPEAIAMRIQMKDWTVEGPVAAYAQPLPPGLFEAAVAMNLKTHDRIDISDRVKDNTLIYDVPAGSWKIMVFTLEKGNKGVILDYLDPAAVDRFIELSLQPYYNRFPQHFGKTIDSVFYDEPNFNSFDMGGRSWTRNYRKWFVAAKGYNPVPLYPALFIDVGPDTDAARYALMHYRAQLFSEGYPKRMQEWGDAHGGIAITGHILLEQMVQPTGWCGDLMLAFKHQKIPGVDEIGYYGNAHEVYKVISSAAYNWDKELVMTEIFGASSPTEKGLYQSIMSEYAKGINLCIPHAVWNDPDAGMFSPELSFRNPKYASILPAFNEFVGRCQRILQGGRHVADIAMVYPIATLNAGYDLPRGVFGQGSPEADYQEVGEALSFGVLRDFTYLHPEVLDQKCRINGDTLRLDNVVNWEEFKVVILPGSRVVNVNTLKKIADFYNQGGKVIFTTKLPEKSAELGRDAEVQHLVSGIFGDDIYKHNELEPVRFDPVTTQKVRLLIRGYNYGMPEVREFSIPGVAEPGAISASDESLPHNGAAKAADGNLNTYWRGEGPVGWNERWLQLAFSAPQTFASARVVEDTGRMKVYEIQYWKDGKWHTCPDNNLEKYAYIEKHNDRGGKAIFVKKPHPKLLARALDSLIAVYDVKFEEPPKEVEVCKFGVRAERSGWFSYIHKVKEGRNYYFIANAKDEKRETTIRIRGKFVPKLMFPATGTTALPKYEHVQEAGVTVTRIHYAFKPVEAVFVAEE